MAKVLVLAGASGTGKTTLADRLIKRSSRRWVHLEADSVAPELHLPSAGPVFDQTSFLHALTESVLSWPRHGYNSVIDGFLPYPEDELFRWCYGVLDEKRARFVDVHASTDVVVDRIRRRGHGHVEWAVRQLDDINTSVDMDYSIDTTMPYEDNNAFAALCQWMDSD